MELIPEPRLAELLAGINASMERLIATSELQSRLFASIAADLKEWRRREIATLSLRQRVRYEWVRLIRHPPFFTALRFARWPQSRMYPGR